MFFFESPIARMKREDREREYWKSFTAKTPAVPWTEDFKITRQPIVFDAGTWSPFRLFDVECGPNSSRPHEGLGVLGPKGLWIYDEATLGAASPLPLITGAVRSKWLFSAPAPVTRLWEFTEKDMSWRLWMSYTPFEIASQRPGLRFAKGHVVVAGLGMGWLLSRCAQKPSVKKITLVERNAELCDWLLPQIRSRHMQGVEHKLDVVIGDANQVVPGLTADVALWDIWEGIGDVDARDEQKMSAKCPGIQRTWFWGAHIKEERERSCW